MLRTVFLILLTITLSTQCFAQYSETIASDRPGQAIGATTTGSRVLQVQAGIAQTGSTLGQYSTQDFSTEVNLRYGIRERLELNTLIDFQHRYSSTIGSPFSLFQGLKTGVRYHIYTGEGLIPSIGIQGRINFPNLFDGIKSFVTPTIQLSLSQALGEKLGLTTNWGLEQGTKGDRLNAFYIINLGYTLNGKWSCFIENYGNYYRGSFFTYFDAGFGYLLNNNLLLDISGGLGANRALPNQTANLTSFLSLGISARGKHKKLRN